MPHPITHDLPEYINNDHPRRSVKVWKAPAGWSWQHREGCWKGQVAMTSWRDAFRQALLHARGCGR